jgi:hypothetical protein
MTRNETLRAAIAVTLAHKRHAEAVDSLARVKARGDTQAQRRAQMRVTGALHDLMRAELEASRCATT